MLTAGSMQAPGPSGVRWFEMDFKEVTRRKAAIIAASEPLRKLLGPQDRHRIHPGERMRSPEGVGSERLHAYARAASPSKEGHALTGISR